MLIFHCRIRLFLAIIQQRTYLGSSDYAFAGTAGEFHTDFPPCISDVIYIFKYDKNSTIFS